MHNDYDSPVFLAFCRFIMEQPTPPTLRQIKAVFTEASFSALLERLVAKNVIKRDQRRYQLNFPIYSKKDQIACLEAFQQAHPFQNQGDIFTGTWLQHACHHQNSLQYFYACDENIPQATIFQVAHPMFQWFTVSQVDWPKTMPAFFAANQRQLTLADYQELMRLVGDVDVSYYSDQVGVIFERILKHKKVRPSIFLRSLQLTGIVSSEESPSFLVPHHDTMTEPEDIGLPVERKTLFMERLLLAQMLGESVSQDTLFFKRK